MEGILRITSFLAILIVMGLAESRWPRRKLDVPKARRWLTNLSISTLSTLTVQIIFPILPAGLAVYCAKHDIGLLNQINLPDWLEVAVTVVLFDLLIYGQHVLFHKHPLLWRIHRMHHADLNLDASTAIRFHPIEIAASMMLKLAAVLVLGPPATGVVLFEIILNGCALFNHANIRLPLDIDAILRRCIVTPDMHRVHHSTDMREANSNFGFNFSYWDRLFSTYKAQPDAGHDGMRIGLNIFRDPQFLGLVQTLAIPFK